ncbi:tyrosine-type recombinase/integrase [Occultella kanbiaonis]|uniref:tyrosine-type recombinase/integrase n=1 Tax=Occultella kanbiaonis TaxID=2675754 RepID=UPI0013D77436|nr:site-specific integrase [Occultella kanbiaonis]
MTRRRQRGEGSIGRYETADGTRFQVQWYEPVDPDDPDAGYRRRTKAGFTTQKESATELRKAITAVEEGRITRAEGTTVATYAREWLAGARIADTTRAGYAKILRLQVIPYLGDRRLVDLRPAHLSKLYRDLENHGRADGGGLGANSVLKVHVLVSTILQAAVHDHLITQNPTRSPRANPPSAREVKGQRRAVTAWTVEQTELFLRWSASTEHWMHAAWVVLAYTGLRRSELLGLQWQDVDLAGGRLVVRRPVTLVKEKGKGERLVIAPPKSNRERVVDVDDEVVGALRRHRSQTAMLGFQYVATDRHVFADRRGGARHPERFSRIWRNALGAARRDIAANLPAGVTVDEVLPYTDVHGQRHAHASQLIAGGAQIKVVQERLGRATASITSEIYTHTAPTAQRDAIQTYAQQRAMARESTTNTLGDAPGGAAGA